MEARAKLFGHPIHQMLIVFPLGLLAEEIGIDSFQADRSPDKRYRTTPLNGLFVRAKPGFYHDGRFADYRAVVDHYDGHLRLQLNEQEKNDLIEFLKSL
jgi:hypothetical protein